MNMTKKYELTEAHKKQLPAYRDKWIKNAMSTKPMDERERALCRKAVKGLYLAANLIPPPDHRIVFVPSPFVLRFAGGFASAIWWLRKNNHKTKDVDAATRAATRAATDAATDAATHTETRNQWFNIDINQMRNIADRLGVGLFGLKCAQNAYNMWQGGNQWSAWASFLGFFKDVAKLKLDYSKYKHWEILAKHSGPRIMHSDFCMISDRPQILTVNDRNQPHHSAGPFCKWRDGSAIYSMNGVRVPQWVAKMNPQDFTKEMITKEKNADVRREIIRKIGNERMLQLLDYKTIDTYQGYDLITFDIGDGRVRPFLKMQNPSDHRLMHLEGVLPEITTVKAAICYRNGLTEYSEPKQLT